MSPIEAARAWRKDLPQQHRNTDDLRAVMIFARSALAYTLLFAGIFLLPAWWARLACMAAMPVVIGALFVIGHDAAHGALARSEGLNRLLARLALLPAYHPYTSWRYAHNVLHHGGTCLKQKQPDFPPMSQNEFKDSPRWRQRLERVYRSAAGVGVCYALEFYARYLLFPANDKRSHKTAAFHLDRLLVLGFLIMQLAAGYSLATLNPSLNIVPSLYAGIVVLPWMAWMYFMGVVTFVQHTHPRTVWYDDPDEWSFYHVQLCSSTHMVLPSVIDYLLHNITHHPAHHIDPTIPLYELPASQRLLEEAAPEHSVVIPFTLAEYLRICRACKLYDYRRHCWLDFDGRPTSEPATLLPGKLPA